ncbi:MAG: DMT family transporter [Sphingomonadales bacterium]|nr:DMT family transporter [Sphingomonadales bacterium]
MHQTKIQNNYLYAVSKTQIIQAHIALLVVNLLYGANHVLAKGVMPQYLDPTTFILLRVSGAVALFWLLLLFQKRKPVDRSDYWRFAAAGLFGVAINQLFFFHGLNLSSALNAGIIMALNPLMVFILAVLFSKDKLNATNGIGVLIGAIGAILLTLSSGHTAGTSSLGDLFLLINALSYAFYLVLSKPLLLKYSPLQVITYVFSIGFLLLLLFPPTWNQLAQVDFSVFPSSVWYKIIYVIVGVTFLTYLLTIFGLKYVSATVSAAYIYTQPIMVILFTVLFAALGWADNYTHTITVERLLYMFFIFTGVYLVSFHKTKR